MMGNDVFALPTATHTRVEFDACGLRGVATYNVDNFGKRFFDVVFSRKDGGVAVSYSEDANTGDYLLEEYDGRGQITARPYYNGYGAAWGKLENHSLYPYIQEVKAACRALRSLDA